MRTIYRIVGILAGLAGFLFWAHGVMMWLGGIIITPLGFSFGVSEASSYATTGEKLTNLFWHVVPGVVGFGLSLVSFLAAVLLVWGSISAWRRGGV
jgi:hypothetical protein